MEAKEAKEAKETVADIVAEKRDRANEIERDVAEKMASGKMVSDQYAREVIAELRKEADRLDAAWKRETQTYLDQIRDAMNQFGHEKFKSEHAPVGNTAAMREACVNIVEYARSARCHTDDAHVLGFLDQIERWAQAALAEPPRNCDVGTEEEQKRMFKEYCGKHYDLTKHRGCEGCPARNYIAGWGVPYCQLRWEQLPYEAEEGGAK